MGFSGFLIDDFLSATAILELLFARKDLTRPFETPR